MKKAAIVTDSVACIPSEQIAEFNIIQVPMLIIFEGEVLRDGTDISPTEFYSRLRQAKKLPTTSHPSPDAFLEAYRQASQQSTNILCITIPSKFSATLNSALLATEMAKESLPGVTIEVIDCGTAAAAQGLVVLAAARAATSGKSLDEVIETARNIMTRVHLYATLDTLHYLVKGGRVPRAAALAGSLLQIKPIFTIVEGEAHPVANFRAASAATNYILKIMEHEAVKKQPLHVAVMHADALERAITLKNQIFSHFDCAELFITEFTPVMGAHTGPGLIGVAFYSGD